MILPFTFLLSICTPIACGDKTTEDTTIEEVYIDDDGDGRSLADGDCDDNDPNSTTTDVDADCDGILTADDCDDNNPTSTTFAHDADCDGILTADDCDDNDTMSNTISEDADCDGTFTADDCDDNDPTSLVISEDADCDGTITAEDCDDNDANSTIVAEDADCDTILTQEDCDDNNPTSTSLIHDHDCDGILTHDDCNDDNPTSTVVADDTDCDGVINEEDCDDTNPLVGATDFDGDGFIACFNDCDDNDASIGATDFDGDGLLACVNDCDDNDTSIGATDFDGDGFIACIDDCDDNSATTYPGVAYNEADPTSCLQDADGDGYAKAFLDFAGVCLMLELVDTFGDGWNGNAIHIYEDGVLTGTYMNDAMYTANDSQWEQHCINSNSSSLTMVFETGLYIPEVVFNIYMDDSTGTPELIGAGHGAGNNKIIFNDTMFGDGQTFFSNATGGSDCDDTDASTFGDTDGDGYTSCTTDCDDNDAAVNPGVDADMDGYSVCTDCNDTNANINPAMTEIWYDGVDRNCDGASDYDQDGDGAEVMTFTTNTGNLVVWGGLDCNDQNPLYHPLANETDPTLCYYDYDDDGYGDDSLSPTAMGYGAVEGSDCNDSYEFVYPGAAYNEMDVNGDGVTDCTCDYDGDGFGDDFPNLYYNAVSGTDLDDSDAHIH